MKTIFKTLLFFALILPVSSCRDLEGVNTDPNNPEDVSTATLMTGSQKKMMDYIYDNWFSGRQALPYAQYWAQRTYTEEDRYQIRESVNNSYFNIPSINKLDRVKNIQLDKLRFRLTLSDC